MSYLGHYLKGEFEKRREDLHKQKNPESSASRGKHSAPRKVESVTDDERAEIWQTLVGRYIYSKAVLFINGGAGAGGATLAAMDPMGLTGGRRKRAVARAAVVSKPKRWRIEKPLTGDEKIDGNPHKGERKVFDDEGQLVHQYDASGKLIWARANG